MHRTAMICMLCLAVTLLISCSSDEQPLTAPHGDSPEMLTTSLDHDLVAGAIMRVSDWPYDPDVAVPEQSVELDNKVALSLLFDHGRDDLGGGIAHYWWVIPFGPDSYERIKLHRVVKERRPYRPIRTRDNIFLMHGDAVAFAPEFINGGVLPNVADDFGLAIYLAAGDVDVWGMDQPWKLIGLDEVDFSYMADWGLDFAADRLGDGLTIARLLRLFTGSGYGKLNLLGYSSGVGTGFALLGQETLLPNWRRNVGGFIAADQAFVPSQGSNPSACGLAEFYRNEYENGVFEDQYFGIYFIELGNLAAADPDAPSPYFEGFTNLQAALGWGVYPEDGATSHLVAGTFDGDGLPTGLQYTAVPGYIDFLQGASPYDPTRFVYEVAEVGCGETETPFDDNLGAIEVPVLGIGAAGGAGSDVFHTFSLLGSTDVTTVLVQLHEDGDEAIDFGHVDIWTADNAPDLVWQPILQWIDEHSGRLNDDTPLFAVGLNP